MLIRRLDRYVISEYLGPFAFGVGIFAVILAGAQLTPWMLRLLVRDGYPASIVLRIFVLRLPALLVLTFPMATVFGSLMAMASLSSSGEVIALRAGGLSFARLSASILVMGLVTSAVSLTFNEVLVPLSNDAAHHLVAAYARNAQPMEDFTFTIPAKGPPQRIVHAGRFDPAAGRLSNLTVMEMREGRLWQVFSAREATWRGEVWLLSDVEHIVVDKDNRQHITRVASVTHDVGRSPAELSKLDKDLPDMSMAELHQELSRRQRLNLPWKPDQVQVVQTMHMRWAIPWVSFGFALIGVPLGLRPARATKGIGLGLSLFIVFAYYVLFNTFNVIGNQAALPPVVAAWVPNLVVYAIGLTLFLTSRR